MFKKIRIACLLVVLAVVAVGAYHDNYQDWSQPIYVMLYPINADNSAASDRYIAKLGDDDFADIEHYLQHESQKYGQNARFYYQVVDELDVLPPAIPKDKKIWNVALWSLQFRYYAYKHARDNGKPYSLRLFLLYYDHGASGRLTHTSTALQNGRIGVVHLFASDTKTQNNNVVIAHESLHAFGASDKYDTNTGQPLEPIGLGDPNQQPRYPQTRAELMAVHKAISPTQHSMARQLSETLIGRTTAAEIGWQESP